VTKSSKLDWSDLDRRTVDAARALAMDAVEAAGSGHPGTAMSLAPAAYLLFQRLLRHDPTDPTWVGRDRFVLSCGHSSLTLYLQLFLSGYGLTLEDIAHLRQWGSLTPGHPEHGHTVGVETTTGPLGQGVGNAVGMAMAARRERGLLDPETADGQSPFDHTIWCFASDGDLEEGVSAEASSLAGSARWRAPRSCTQTSSSGQRRTSAPAAPAWSKWMCVSSSARGGSSPSASSSLSDVDSGPGSTMTSSTCQTQMTCSRP
jgi:transketolase